MRSSKPVLAWAWMLEDGSLCHWAEPNKCDLAWNDGPSPGAKPVRVKLTVHVPKRRGKKAMGKHGR